jgi:hypothetical protein
LFHNPVLKGHGFSRAAEEAKESGALAPEGHLENVQQSVMKQLLDNIAELFGFQQIGLSRVVC